MFVPCAPEDMNVHIPRAPSWSAFYWDLVEAELKKKDPPVSTLCWDALSLPGTTAPVAWMQMAGWRMEVAGSRSGPAVLGERTVLGGSTAQTFGPDPPFAVQIPVRFGYGENLCVENAVLLWQRNDLLNHIKLLETVRYGSRLGSGIP